MRIECSNCGSLVRARTNDNGEVNCPRCGAGLLVVSATRDHEINRYDDRLAADEVAGSASGWGRAIVIATGAALFAALLIVAALRILRP